MTDRAERIVAATPLQAPALAAIHAEAAAGGECWSAASFASLLQAGGAFGVIDPAGGFAIARVAADEAELIMLAVIRRLRRHGIGTALLRAAEQRAQERGAAAMFLEVSRSNEAAIALYAKAGYRQVAIRRRYYADGADALVLRRDLSPSG